MTEDALTKPVRRMGWPGRIGCGCLGLVALLVIASFLDPLGGNRMQSAADQAQTLNNARQIVGALRTYATDHDGKFPEFNPDGSPIISANQAFRALFPKYLTSERIFFAKDVAINSAWTLGRPDDLFDDPSVYPGKETLRPGENHFAYVLGLTDSSNAELPLVADGFTAPAGGIIADPVYAGSPTEKGGLWQGKVAIVVHLDQSAQKVKLTGESQLTRDGRVFRLLRTNARGEKRNLFSADPSDPKWLQPGQGVVDPE